MHTREARRAGQGPARPGGARRRQHWCFSFHCMYPAGPGGEGERRKPFPRISLLAVRSCIKLKNDVGHSFIHSQENSLKSRGGGVGEVRQGRRYRRWALDEGGVGELEGARDRRMGGRRVGLNKSNTIRPAPPAVTAQRSFPSKIHQAEFNKLPKRRKTATRLICGKKRRENGSRLCGWRRPGRPFEGPSRRRPARGQPAALR